MELQKIQSFVKVLQSYSTLCTEKSSVMSRLVNAIIMQIMSLRNFCSVWRRSLPIR